VPEDLPDAAAAGTAYINPLTAWLMVERFCAAGVREVVITAATSTIAGHLAQLLSTRGITPIGLVRGTPGRAVAEPSLWRDVLATSDPAWPDRLRHVAGGRTDVVLDCVGGAQGALLMVFLAPGGVLVHYGLLSGEPLPRACFDGRRGTRVELFHLRETVHSMPRHELPALFGPVFEHLRAGRMLTRCAQEVPLSRRPAGKVLVACRGWLRRGRLRPALRAAGRRAGNAPAGWSGTAPAASSCPHAQDGSRRGRSTGSGGRAPAGHPGRLSRCGRGSPSPGR